MRRAALIIGAWIALAATCIAAAATGHSTLAVQNAWIRQPPPGIHVGAAYFTLRNTGDHPVTVVDVQCADAHSAMIHETVVSQGQSRMLPHPRLTIAPGHSVTLRPGGLHVMLNGLTHPLKVGERVPLVLLLAGGGKLTVMAEVRPLDTQ